MKRFHFDPAQGLISAEFGRNIVQAYLPGLDVSTSGPAKGIALKFETSLVFVHTWEHTTLGFRFFGFGFGVSIS